MEGRKKKEKPESDYLMFQQLSAREKSGEKYSFIRPYRALRWKEKQLIDQLSSQTMEKRGRGRAFLRLTTFH